MLSISLSIFLNGFSSSQGNDFRLQGGRTNIIKAGLKLTTGLRVVTVRLATLLKHKCPDERYIGGLQMCFFFDGNLCDSWINENVSEVRNNWNVLHSKADKDAFHIDTCLYCIYIYLYNTYTHKCIHMYISISIYIYTCIHIDTHALQTLQTLYTMAVGRITD